MPNQIMDTYMSNPLNAKFATVAAPSLSAQATDPWDWGSFGWGILTGVIIAGVGGALIVIFVLPVAGPAGLAAQVGVGALKGLFG